MAPAVINIVFRYELLATSPIEGYAKIYEESKSAFTREVRSREKMGRAVPNDYNKFESYFKNEIDEYINSLVQRIGYNGVVEIPFPTDESGELKLKTSKISFQIKEGNTQTGVFSINLYFHSELLTLVGTLGDKLLISQGDKTAEMANKTGVSVFSIKHTPDIWIDSYQKI